MITPIDECGLSERELKSAKLWAIVGWCNVTHAMVEQANPDEPTPTGRRHYRMLVPPEIISKQFSALEYDLDKVAAYFTVKDSATAIKKANKILGKIMAEAMTERLQTTRKGGKIVGMNV